MRRAADKVLGYLQKIGRALMVPVALLPAAAILVGAGYWIDPSGWGGGSAIAALLIKAGSAILDNMSMLFAVGVAYGMSKDKDGAAALAGLVGFLVVTTLLGPSSVAQIQGIAADKVPAAFAHINNQFTGILSGVVAAELYNRFGGVELPRALAFFSGRRFVPIVTSAVMVGVSFVLMAVWPAVYGGLVGFGKTIVGLGPLGAGVYGFCNRLLIPFGLHHALNSVFWFNVAGINDIPSFLGGARSLADGSATKGVTGMYQAGFFPIMMFGLPAAGLAIYHTARAEDRPRVGALMLAAGVAAFFTGVTEPLEFAFMFVAPLLYLVHAFLTGLSLFIAASMHWMAGFGFSAGLIDLVLSTRNPLAVQWYMLLVQGVAFGAVYYAVFRALIVRFDLATPGREASEAPPQDAQSEEGEPVEQSSVSRRCVDALGGLANLDEVDACITRLRLTLHDPGRVDEPALKALGAAGVIRVGPRGVQVVFGPRAERMAEEIKALQS
jgi:PTS system N-acetylglucosamine-specific IIC component